jgi:hypothetical protein
MLFQLCVSNLSVHSDPNAVSTFLKHIIDLTAVLPTFSEETLYATKETIEITTQIIINSHVLKPLGHCNCILYLKCLLPIFLFIVKWDFYVFIFIVTHSLEMFLVFIHLMYLIFSKSMLHWFANAYSDTADTYFIYIVFEVFMAMVVKISVFWNITLCSLLKVNPLFQRNTLVLCLAYSSTWKWTQHIPLSRLLWLF